MSLWTRQLLINRMWRVHHANPCSAIATMVGNSKQSCTGSEKSTTVLMTFLIRKMMRSWRCHRSCSTWRIKCALARLTRRKEVLGPHPCNVEAPSSQVTWKENSAPFLIWKTNWLPQIARTRNCRRRSSCYRGSRTDKAMPSSKWIKKASMRSKRHISWPTFASRKKRLNNWRCS